MPSTLPPEGSLGAQDVSAVVGSICARGWTGALVVSHGGFSRTLHWEGGKLVAVASRHPDDRVPDVLLRRGRLALADYAALPRDADETVLVARGLLRDADLPGLLDELAELVAGRVLDAVDGQYRMNGAAAREGRPLRRSTAELVTEAVHRIESWARVESALGGPAATYRRSDRYEDVVPELRLSFERLSILTDLHGERTVQDLCADSTLPDFDVCRLLLAFRILGAIVRTDEPTHVEMTVDDDGLGDVLDEEEAAAEEIATSAPPARRVLLVAIDAELATALEPMLGRAAFAVDRAADGPAALLACSRVRFDVVIVADPPGGGLAELLEALRRTGAATHAIVAAAEGDVARLRASLGESPDLAIVPRDAAPLLEELASRLLGAARRVGARLLVRLQVRVASNRQLVLLQTDNVSATGMLLRTDQQFPVGTAVALEFTLPGDRHPIVGDGEVVRHTVPPLETGRGIGVRYLGFRGDGQKRLEDYLAGLVSPR